MNRRQVYRGVGLAGIVLAWGLACCQAAENPPKLRYGFEKDREYQYEVKITGELPEQVITLAGTLTYRVLSASGDQFALKREGILTPQVKYTDSSRPFGPPRHFGRFGGPRFGPWNGPESTTLSRTGNLIVTGSQTHLPFLLGNEETLVIEPLADEAQASWTKERELVIVEHESQGPFFSIRPHSMNETKSGSKERTDYAVLEQKDGTVRIRKTYSLKSAPEDGVCRLDMSGSGEFQFDLKQGVIKSQSVTYKILMNEKNVIVTIPVTVTNRLLSEAEVAERKKRAEEAAAAKAEAERPKPFAPGEREKLIAELRSGDENRIKAAAQRLGRTIPDGQPAAAEAVAGQMFNSRGAAGAALRAMGPVAESVTLPFLSDRDHWIRAEACKVVAEVGGRKSLEALKQRAQECEEHERRMYSEAIAAIEKRLPDLGNAEEEPAPAAGPALRTWHDATRSFAVEARFLSFQNEQVTLQRKDGRKITLPLEKLCEEDREFVKKQPKPVNPFE